MKKPDDPRPAAVGDLRGSRVYLVDAQPLMRRGLRDFLATRAGCVICGEAATIKQAMAGVQAAAPDLVIMDLALPDGNGLRLLKHLQGAAPGAGVLVYTMHDELLYAERVVKAGGRGYLLKDAPPQRLLSALGRVRAGGIDLSERATREILDGIGSTPQRGLRTSLACLSARELEVFEMLGRGGGKPEIARRLKVSTRTIDTHRTNIKLKLGLRSFDEVLRRAVMWVELDGGEAAGD